MIAFNFRDGSVSEAWEFHEEAATAASRGRNQSVGQGLAGRGRQAVVAEEITI
jgi:hypothetical protein